MDFRERMKSIADTVKYPLLYAGAFGGVASIVTALQTRNLGEGVKAGVYNLPFFLAVTSVYAKGVNYVTKRFGRVGANVLSLSVAAAFYAYARTTGDSDPTYPSLANAALGLTLTNIQVSDLEKRLGD